jgi:NAD(P)H-hydrate epimerase
MEAVSQEKMREIKETVTQKYGIPRDVMIEQAGFQVANLVREKFSDEPNIAVICGRDENGASGFVAARRLLSWGFNIEVYTPFKRDRLSRTAYSKLQNIEDMNQGVNMMDFPTANVHIDALTRHCEGPLVGDVAKAVEKMEKWSADTVSVDAPSGINADTGEGHDPCVRPDYTVMLGLPKKGLSRENSGRLFLADTGIPIHTVEENDVDAPDFKSSSLIDISN